MSAPQTLIQAALQRLGARLGSSLIDAAATLSVLAQDAPERLREEFQLFWQEVEAEAQRIEHGDAQGAATGGAPAPATAPQAAPGPTPADPQHRIDALRARIATLAQRLDQQ